MRRAQTWTLVWGLGLASLALVGCLSNPTPHPGKGQSDVRADARVPTSGEEPGDFNEASDANAQLADCLGGDTEVREAEVGVDAEGGSCSAADAGPAETDGEQ